MTKSPDRALHKHIRILPEQWQRVSRAAEGTVYSANQILVELTMVALDRRASLGAAIEHRLARASLFAALATARRFIADGREEEVREIREFISTIVPDPDTDSPSQNTGRQGLAERQRTGREGVPEVMNTHIGQFGSLPDAPPGMLEIGEMGARLPALDHPGVVLVVGETGQEPHGRRRQRHRPSSSLRIRQAELARLEVHLPPA